MIQDKFDTIKNTYEETSEYKKILKKINEKKSTTKENICLIFPGAFNPFTPFHLEIAIESIKYIENIMSKNVVGCILLQSNSCYEKIDMTLGYTRYDLINDVINCYGDQSLMFTEKIIVSNFEAWQNEFVATSITLKYFSEILTDIKVFYICGQDVYDSIMNGKYTFYQYFDNVNFLVHPRSADPIRENFNIKIQSLYDGTEYIFRPQNFVFIPYNQTREFSVLEGSSTMIRDLAKQRDVQSIRRIYWDNENISQKIISIYNSFDHMAFPLMRKLVKTNFANLDIVINTQNILLISELNALSKKFNFNIEYFSNSSEFTSMFVKNVCNNPDMIKEIKNIDITERFFFLNKNPTKREEILIKKNKDNIMNLIKDDGNLLISELLLDDCKKQKLTENLRMNLFSDVLEFLHIQLGKCSDYLDNLKEDKNSEIRNLIELTNQNIYQIFQNIIKMDQNEETRELLSIGAFPDGSPTDIHPYGNIENNKFSYEHSMKTITKCLEIIDIFHRKYSEKRLAFRKMQFYNRYAYYVDYLINEYPNVIIVPCIFSIGSTDLMKFRFTPYQICGVICTNTFVDESIQTPLEFFIHDINHSRRIHQHNIYFITNKNKSFINFFNELWHEKQQIMGILRLDPSSSVFQKEILKIIKMILFEIIHEDALVPDKNIIIQDILFEGGKYLYPYESTTNPNCKFENVETYRNTLSRYICKWYEKAATTLSTFKKKIEYEFFDPYNEINEIIMSKNYRTEFHVLISSLVLLYSLDYQIDKNVIKLLCKNIQDTSYTASPFGKKYSFHLSYLCNLNDVEIDMLLSCFLLGSSTKIINWKNLEDFNNTVISKYNSEVQSGGYYKNKHIKYLKKNNK
jgi:nicotinic acid mononucleotide adenylyltransferase